jgi:hypothetical protein
VPLVALGLAFLVVILALLLMPLTLVQRYRVGTARRPARAWVAVINLVGIAISVVLFLTGSAITNLWVPGAFAHSIMGVAAGGTLGLLGLALTRWEPSPRALHYTPNRWLVLLVTVLVSARIAYGLWRSWQVAQAGLGGAPALAAFGVAESMSAAAIVIGYFLAFNAGVLTRLRQWQKRPLRTM